MSCSRSDGRKQTAGLLFGGRRLSDIARDMGAQSSVSLPPRGRKTLSLLLQKGNTVNSPITDAALPISQYETRLP